MSLAVFLWRQKKSSCGIFIHVVKEIISWIFFFSPENRGARSKVTKPSPKKVHLGVLSKGDSDSEDEDSGKHVFDHFSAMEKDVMVSFREDNSSESHL